MTEVYFERGKWHCDVVHRSGAVVMGRSFATEGEALTQQIAWETEMGRTGVLVGSSPASYER